MGDSIFGDLARLSLLKPQNYPVENQYLERWGNDNFKVGVASMQGFRDHMEDAHTAILSLPSFSEMGYFAVYDGHNGCKASTWCSENAHSYILTSTPKLDEETLKKRMIELDQLYFENTKDDTNGTTAVYAIVQKTNEFEDKPFKLTVGNLGDSRCLIGHYSSPTFRCMTVDHKPNNPEEVSRIKSAGGFVARGRVDACLAVARAIGDHSYKSNKNLPPEQQKIIPVPDITHAYLGPDDFLIICCDGIFESYSNETLMDYIYKNQSNDTAKMLSELLTKVLSRGSRDNMTCMMIELKDGKDYNKGGEFIVGQWYSHANQSYTLAYESNCKKYGKTPEEVQKIWNEKKKEIDKLKAEKKKQDCDNKDEKTNEKPEEKEQKKTEDQAVGKKSPFLDLSSLKRPPNGLQKVEKGN